MAFFSVCGEFELQKKSVSMETVMHLLKLELEKYYTEGYIYLVPTGVRVYGDLKGFWEHAFTKAEITLKIENDCLYYEGEGTVGILGCAWIFLPLGLLFPFFFFIYGYYIVLFLFTRDRPKRYIEEAFRKLEFEIKRLSTVSLEHSDKSEPASVIPEDKSQIQEEAPETFVNTLPPPLPVKSETPYKKVKNTREIIEGYYTRFEDPTIFTSPDIPVKKLSKALMAYAHGVSEKEVLILIDSTVFGSAKRGMLITPTSAYACNLFDKPRQIDFAQVDSASWRKDMLIVNGGDFFDACTPASTTLPLISEMFLEVAQKS